MTAIQEDQTALIPTIDRAQTPAQRVRRMAEAALPPDGYPIDMPAITDQVMAQVSADPELVLDLSRSYLRTMVYDLVKRTAAATREGYVKQGESMVPRPLVTHAAAGPAGLQPPALRKAAASSWERWIENIEDGRSLRLPDMTRVDLLKAAENRERSGKHDLHVARLWRALAARLPDEVTPVRALMDDDAIDAINAEASRLPLIATA